MVMNSEFLMLLKQGSEDREVLKNAMNLSDAQLSMVINSPAGQGLLSCGSRGIVSIGGAPFPKTSKLYKALTSNLKELTEIAEKERRDAAKKEKEAKNLSTIEEE